MSSIKQKQANQQNALKSTGPRTLQGKAVSRFNALKSGIDAESQTIPGEDPAGLDNLAEEYHQRWQPALPEHRVLVDTLVHDDWQLRRLRKAEAYLWGHYYSRDRAWTGVGGNDFARLQRRLDSTARSFHLTLEKLECIAASQPDSEPDSGADLLVCLPDCVQPVEPDLSKPQPLPNQPPTPGIGFVPSTPMAISRWPLSSLPRPSVAAISTPGLPVVAPKPPNRA